MLHVVGGGLYEGFLPAVALAERVFVACLEHNTVAWGASVATVAFCCLGGGAADDRRSTQLAGRGRSAELRAAELAALIFRRLTLISRQ